jgi:hypothetical protein
MSVHEGDPAGAVGEYDPTELFHALSAIVPGTGTSHPHYRSNGQTLEDET